MSDVSITAANVLKGNGALVEAGTSGASITAGQSVYKDVATETWKLADCNAAVALSVAEGISLVNCGAGQPIVVLTSGPCTIGGTLVVGETYYLSDTAGGLMPYADVDTGFYVTIMGVATSASVLRVQINASQTAKAAS